MFCYQVRRSTRPEVLALAEHLAAEYAADFPPGTVLAEVVRAREAMFAHGVREGIIDATEASARLRLRRRIAVAPYQPVGRMAAAGM